MELCDQSIATEVPGQAAVCAGGQTAAEQRARQNWLKNLRALERRQPPLVQALQGLCINWQWVFGRDGSLTGLDSSGNWVSECSLPRRLAGELLRKMTGSGVACLVCPSHAAQVDVALEKLDRAEAILAVVPELAVLGHMLHCADFAGEIESGRLWFAAGTDWSTELSRILEQNPGLPVPHRFIRTCLVAESEGSEVMDTARRVFSSVSAARVKLQEELLAGSGRRQPGRRVVLLAGSRFRLWNDHGAILAELMPDAISRQANWRLIHVDPDQPCSSGSMALTLACQEACILVTANCTRAELAQAVPPDLRIISWMTVPRLPRFDSGMAGDALLLAETRWLAVARSLNWPADRLGLASWPARSRPISSTAATHLALIADTRDPSLPAKPFDFSSHQLLWDLILSQLRQNPLAIGTDVSAYLASRMKRLAIQQTGFDQQAFVEELIVPAYQQGIARLLIGAGLPVRLHGNGWDRLPEFSGHWAGAVQSREELEAAAESAVLVHAWPWVEVHPVESLGRPVLRCAARRAEELASEAHRLLKCPAMLQPEGPALSGEMIRCWLERQSAIRWASEA